MQISPFSIGHTTPGMSGVWWPIAASEDCAIANLSLKITCESDFTAASDVHTNQVRLGHIHCVNIDATGLTPPDEVLGHLMQALSPAMLTMQSIHVTIGHGRNAHTRPSSVARRGKPLSTLMYKVGGLEHLPPAEVLALLCESTHLIELHLHEVSDDISNHCIPTQIATRFSNQTLSVCVIFRGATSAWRRTDYDMYAYWTVGYYQTCTTSLDDSPSCWSYIFRLIRVT